MIKNIVLFSLLLRVGFAFSSAHEPASLATLAARTVTKSGIIPQGAEHELFAYKQAVCADIIQVLGNHIAIEQANIKRALDVYQTAGFTLMVKDKTLAMEKGDVFLNNALIVAGSALSIDPEKLFLAHKALLYWAEHKLTMYKAWDRDLLAPIFTIFPLEGQWVDEYFLREVIRTTGCFRKRLPERIKRQW